MRVRVVALREALCGREIHLYALGVVEVDDGNLVPCCCCHDESYFYIEFMFLFLTFKNALEHCPLEYIFRLDGHGVSETLMPDIPRLVIFGVVTTAYPRESRGGKRGGDVLAPAGHDGRERHLSLPVADEVAAVGEDGEHDGAIAVVALAYLLLPFAVAVRWL